MTEHVYDDATGDLLEVRRPLGHTTVYTYYPDGRLHTRLDPNGKLTTWTWVDAGPWTVTETVAQGEPDRTTTFTYNQNGKLQRIEDARGKWTDFTYFPNGDLETTTDPLGTTTSDPNDHVTHFEYDALGRRTAVVDPLNHRTETTYNTRGQVLRVRRFKDGGAAIDTSFQYDKAGRRVKVTDPLLNATDYEYDSYGRLWKVKAPSLTRTRPTTTYEYDIMSNLWKLTDAESHTTTFSYDGHNRLEKTTYPGPELREERYTYDPAGRLQTRRDRRGVVTTYGYDALGRLTGKSFSDGSFGSNYFYDENGDKGFMTSAEGPSALQWDYDLAGQVRTETARKTLDGLVYSVVSYLYDSGGNRTTLSLDGQVVSTYEYDAAARLENLWRGSNLFHFGYDDAHRRQLLNLPNGAVTDYEYDALSQLVSVGTSLGTTSLTSSSYTYDDAGNRQTKTHPEYAESYGFDMEYRVQQVLRNASPTETYTYDNVGNRKSSIQYPAWSYNPRNELGSYGPYTLTYDFNGNLATKTDNGQTWTYEWNAENQLTRVLLNGVQVATFEYDPLGRRRAKVSSSDSWRWAYDGGDILRETTGGPSRLYIHGPGIDEPLAQEEIGTLSYLLSDGLGSVLKVTDAQGNAVVTRRYNAFGEPELGSTTPGYAYTGREWDPEVGLYYYRARYYDPRVGRFLSEDPIGFDGGVNFYSYVRNNPIVGVDPSGKVDYRITEEEVPGFPFAGGRTGVVGSVKTLFDCKDSCGKFFPRFTVIARIVMMVDRGCPWWSRPHEKAHAAVLRGDIKRLADQYLAPVEGKGFGSYSECAAAAQAAKQQFEAAGGRHDWNDGGGHAHEQIDNYWIPCVG